MANPRHTRTYLADYRIPRYLVDAVDLHFEIDPECTRVTSRMQVRRNPAATDDCAPLVLQGRDLVLKSLAIDGRSLEPDEYELDGGTLSTRAPDACEVRVETEIRPAGNTSGLGMFVARGVIATHCEAEGFRKMTFFPDRPDVLSTYTVTLSADRARYPVLLSNGNRVASGTGPDGRHWTTWHDPYPKPSYIFAVVAGNLAELADEYVTRSGRRVQLRIHANPDRIASCRHAMDSLIRSMRWDEAEYGLEYDLDTYHIVALDDFAGAQENKGLNVFDAQTLVAHADVATDDDYMLIERIVGHEYFHNWTGNRVTCRDWFQLSLKEGLTRFRDQEFSRAMSAAGEKRVEAVRKLRADQFAEDSGPNAHPVKPDSFIEVANFYTTTVYEKGAEVIRMLRTLLGAEAYLRGVHLYLQRYDGQAVTTEDFVRTLEDASGRDLTQFRLWYHQAGTPHLQISTRYDAAARTYALTVRQSCPPTPGQPQKEPMHIPLAVGLLAADGREIGLSLRGDPSSRVETTRVLEIRQAEETFEFVDVPEAPVLSVLRDFSAPVTVDIARSDREAAFLVRHDTDAVSRWDNAQVLATRVILGLADDLRAGRSLQLNPHLRDAFRDVLRDPRDLGLDSLLLTLPEENVLGAACETIDLDALAAARGFVLQALARELRDDWLATYRRLGPAGAYQPDAASIARRRLRNLCLVYLCALGESELLELCVRQLELSDNLTDRLAALAVLANTDCPQRLPAIERFYERWRGNDLVINKWLNVQATSRLPGTVERVQALMQHPAFDLKNPAKGMALIGGFCRRNYLQFHEPGGSGYRLFASVALVVDKIKPEGVHWLMPQAMQWRRYDPGRRSLLRAELERMAATPGISRGLHELLANALQAGADAPAAGTAVG
ncbi:MAG TPA: aminopeptidase N [Steroidobacteraceae bacterium]